MTVGVGGDADDAGLVESDEQGDGVSGGEMYADWGFWWWIWRGQGMGFGGEVSVGPKAGIGEVMPLGGTTVNGLVVEVVGLEIVGRS